MCTFTWAAQSLILAVFFNVSLPSYFCLHRVSYYLECISVNIVILKKVLDIENILAKKITVFKSKSVHTFSIHLLSAHIHMHTYVKKNFLKNGKALLF